MDIQYTPNYNDLIRTVINAGIFRALESYGPEAIPVGLFLTDLLGALWPESKEDVWEQIKDKVEALVNKKLDDALYEQVSEDLQGLQNVASDYLRSIDNKYDPSEIKTRWIALNEIILNAKPHFKTAGSEFLLLPLFVQFANIHISVLRDMVACGSTWGCSDNEIADYKQDLGKYIKEYTDYVNTQYANKLNTINPAANKYKTEPFNTRNNFIRQCTLTILDYKDLWKYLDLNTYPTPPDEIVLTREIYSDPYGLADDTGISIPTSPKMAPSKITIWGWDRLDAIQVDYQTGGGPNGVTTTGRMGDTQRPDGHGGYTGGSNQPPHGGSWQLMDATGNAQSHGGYCEAATVRSGTIVNAMRLRFADGTWSNWCGGNQDGGTNYNVEYSGHFISSLKVMGISNFYGSANCLVIGFKLYPIKNPNI